MSDIKKNSFGNWWYVDKSCVEEGCLTLIDACENEYNMGHGSEIRRCTEHYHAAARMRTNRQPIHPITEELKRHWKHRIGKEEKLSLNLWGKQTSSAPLASHAGHCTALLSRLRSMLIKLVMPPRTGWRR